MSNATTTASTWRSRRRLLERRVSRGDEQERRKFLRTVSARSFFQTASLVFSSASQPRRQTSLRPGGSAVKPIGQSSTIAAISSTQKSKFRTTPCALGT
jgi:hypothetical protein